MVVAEIKLESTKGEPRRQGTARRDSGRSDGPSHLAARGWQHKEPPGGGPVGQSEWTRPETTGRRHEAGRSGVAFPSSRSQLGLRAGDAGDDGATARGRALGM